ncbi:MAG: hypothetical protein ACPGCY_06440, partial [Henriciella sp.]
IVRFSQTEMLVHTGLDGMPTRPRLVTKIPSRHGDAPALLIGTRQASFMSCSVALPDHCARDRTMMQAGPGR